LTIMLEMRFLRTGRANQSFFRVVLTEHSKPPQSGFIKILGWYNPHSKETSLDKEEILSWLGKGAKPSNNLSKLLQKEGIKHKFIKYIPKAKKKPKEKGDKAEKAPKPQVPPENAPAEPTSEPTVEAKTPEQESPAPEESQPKTDDKKPDQENEK